MRETADRARCDVVAADRGLNDRRPMDPGARESTMSDDFQAAREDGHRNERGEARPPEG